LEALEDERGWERVESTSSEVASSEAVSNEDTSIEDTSNEDAENEKYRRGSSSWKLSIVFKIIARIPRHEMSIEEN
jgi:hypothetical protein